MMHVTVLKGLARGLHHYNSGILVLGSTNYFIIRFEDYCLLYGKEYTLNTVELVKGL